MLDASSPVSARCLDALRAAGALLDEARAAGVEEQVRAARRQVQTVVDEARQADIPWGVIGEALGVTRGNAYQSYRTRPTGS